MRTAHLLAVAVPILAGLALAPAVPVLSPVLCLVALLAIGELVVRALVREPLTPAARVGLATAAGLISLPLTALILNVLGVDIEGRWLAAGLAVLTAGLGAYCWRRGPAVAPAPPRSRTALAVGVPALLAILIGGTATVVYQRLPHPAEPGYTSLALAGWAAGIAAPVLVPAAGLEVPLQVSSAGEAPSVAHLLVRVGGRLTGPGTPVPIAAGTRPLQAHVPAPPDGCLHVIRISLGPASTVFYGRGPGPARLPGRLVPARPGHQAVPGRPATSGHPATPGHPAVPGHPAIRTGSIAC